MKKNLTLFLILTFITGLVFAEGEESLASKLAPAPEVTAGINAAAEVNLFTANKEDEFATSGPGNQAAKSRPYGLELSTFALDNWVELDWSLLNVKTESKYDALRASDDDFSFIKVTSTWKNFFGLEVTHEFAQDNKAGTAPAAGVWAPANTKNDITLTLDKTDDMGLKAYVVYDANTLLNLNLLQPLRFFGNIVTQFTTLGFELDNDELAAKFVYKYTPTGPGGATLDTATFTAKNMFGVWTAELNNSDEIKLRLDNLDTDSSIGTSSYAIGKDNKVQGNGNMNVLNTFNIIDNLSLKLAVVVPADGADITIADWLNVTAPNTDGDGNPSGDNIAIAATYELANIGTLNAGTSLDIDYKISDGTLYGPSTLIKALTNDWGTAVWFDANLSKILGEEKGLFASVDAQFSSYEDVTATYSGTNVNKMKTVGMSRWSIYGETSMAINEKISFSAAALFKFGLGYDLRKDTGFNYVEQNTSAATYVASNVTKGNVINSGAYEISPLEINVRADFALTQKATIWVSNKFKSLADDYDGEQPSSLGKDMEGFYHENVIELGADLVSTPKSKISVSAGYSLYLGFPSSSDLYVTGLTDAQKASVDADYALWKSTNYDPLNIKASYTYTY